VPTENDEDFYLYNNQKYPRVTAVIGSFGNEFLVQWAANECSKHILETVLPVAENRPHEVKHILPRVCQDAKYRYIEIRDSAGDKGSEIHQLIEWRLKGVNIPEHFYEVEHLAKILDNVDKFVNDWGFEPILYENDVGILEPSIELKLKSEKYNYAGTCDAIGTTKSDKVILFDIKTGKSVQKKVEAQLAAYCMAWREMGGAPPDLAFVVHVLPSGTLKEKFILDKPTYEKKFKAFIGGLKFVQEWGNI